MLINHIDYGSIVKRSKDLAIMADQNLGIVSDEDRFQFETQGFLVLRNVLGADMRAVILARLDELETREFDKGHVTHFSMDNPTEARPQPTPGFSMESTTKSRVDDHYLRMNGLPNLDPIFDRMIDHPRVLPYLQEFIAQPQLSFSWYIAKGLGPRFSRWHSIDPIYYRYRDGLIRSRMVNTAWFLTDNGPEDGCLLVVPGSHKRNKKLDFSAHTGLQLPGSIRVTGKAGDVVLFSECTLHTGDEKISSGVRRNLYYVFADADHCRLQQHPRILRHAWFAPHIRGRFNETQRELTEWMRFVVCNAEVGQ